MDALKTATLYLAAGVEAAGAIIIGLSAIAAFIRALFIFIPHRAAMRVTDEKEIVRLRLGRNRQGRVTQQRPRRAGRHRALLGTRSGLETMELFGISWVGLNAENARKLLLSLAFIAAVLIVSALARWLVGQAVRRSDRATIQTRFWTRQAVSLLAAIVLIAGLL